MKRLVVFCAWLPVQPAWVQDKLKQMCKPLVHSATKRRSWLLGYWNTLRGCSRRGGWKRYSCAHPSLQTAECGNDWTGRRFKIMLLQAVQEREEEEEKNVPWSNVLHHLKGKWHFQSMTRTDVVASVQFFFLSWNYDLATGDVQLAMRIQV